MTVHVRLNILIFALLFITVDLACRFCCTIHRVNLPLSASTAPAIVRLAQRCGQRPGFCTNPTFQVFSHSKLYPRYFRHFSADLQLTFGRPNALEPPAVRLATRTVHISNARPAIARATTGNSACKHRKTAGRQPLVPVGDRDLSGQTKANSSGS